MSSQNLSLVEGSSIDYSCEVLSNKETQTSTTYITDSFALLKGPSRPLPKGIDKSKIETSVNVLDCKVIKDSSDSKTPDHVTEAFIKEIENLDVSISDDAESSRLKYCSEIEPYLQDHLNDCQDNIDSLEQLIQDALEDLPDYQPCFEVYEGSKDIQKKISHTMNMESSKPTNLDESFTEGNPTLEKFNINSEDQCTPVSSNLVCPENIQKLVDSADKTVNNEKIAENTSTEAMKKCVKDNLTALKCSASSCLEKIEYVIGIKRTENSNEKPTYYPLAKGKVQSTASHNVQTETGNSLSSIKDLFDGRNEKMTAIKETVIDLAEKIYKTSKDAFTLIRSESAKFLSKGKTDNVNTDNKNENKPKITLRNVNANSIANILFKTAENKPVEDEMSKNETRNSRTKISGTAPLSIASQIIKITDEIVESRIDKSSPYDKVGPPETSSKVAYPPESRIPTVSAIDRTPEPPSASSMFTIIKSKIFSMFRDESDKYAEAEESNTQNDEEEDPFERFMEQ